MAAAAAQEGSGRGSDSRLNQETARWLQWDKVRGDRVLGPPGGGAGSSACSPGAALVPALLSFPPLPSLGKTEEEDAAAYGRFSLSGKGVPG